MYWQQQVIHIDLIIFININKTITIVIFIILYCSFAINYDDYDNNFGNHNIVKMDIIHHF